MIWYNVGTHYQASADTVRDSNSINNIVVFINSNNICVCVCARVREWAWFVDVRA